MLAFHGGAEPETEEESARVIGAWRSWFESLGAAVADPGAPTGAAMTIAPDGSTTDGVDANPLSGYTTLNADTLEAAVEMAKGAPIFSAGAAWRCTSSFRCRTLLAVDYVSPIADVYYRLIPRNPI